MKNNQKCVRLSDRALRYIERYRGDSFSQKLENYILDTEERREQLVMDWNRLQAQIHDKQNELRALQDKLRQLRTVHAKLEPLVDALLELVG